MMISHINNRYPLAIDAPMRYDDRMINDESNQNDDAIASQSSRINAIEIANHLQINAKSLRAFLRKNRESLAIDHAHRDRYDFSIDDARMIIASFRNRKSSQSRSNRSRDEIASLLND